MSGLPEWVDPELATLTRDLLRRPRFQGLRDDKDPTDVVREVPGTSGQLSG